MKSSSFEVIDGKTLGYCLDGTEMSQMFLKLASGCTSVLCVRATPFQKAAVVKLVRDKLSQLTLAIGKCCVTMFIFIHMYMQM